MKRRKWAPAADEVSEHVRLQCYWYLAALDCEPWGVAALIDDESRIDTNERDREDKAK